MARGVDPRKLARDHIGRQSKSSPDCRAGLFAQRPAHDLAGGRSRQVRDELDRPARGMRPDAGLSVTIQS